MSKFDYTYQPDGNIATWQRQAGSDPATALTLGYDLANQLTSANLAPVATPASITQRYSYQYDKAGNRTSRQVGNEVTSASHNNVNQITSTAGGGKLLVADNTDEPAKVKVNGKPATVTAPPQNLYQAWIDVTPGVNSISIEATDYAPTPNTITKSWTVSVTGGAARSFSYDTNGNTLSDGLRTYEWDAENRLVKITQGANVYEFVYDGLSRRVAEKLNGTITRRWLWDGTQIAEQRDATGNTVQRQYYSQGEKRVGSSDAGNYYYTRDHLGSIREMTDSTASVRARYDYDPYGARTKLSGNLDCDFGFTGHYYHAGSNLHLTLYRAYDQDLGRWLSADPIGEKGELNLYAYVLNDPINYKDRFGLDRKIVGGVHIEIQINKWKCNDGKWVKDGSEIWGFGQDVNSGGEAVWAAVAGMIYYPGTIWKTDSTDQIENGTKTDPDSDMRALKKLRELQKKGMGYNNLVQNCRDFARGFEGYGRDGYGGKSQKPTTNHDGTPWIAPNP